MSSPKPNTYRRSAEIPALVFSFIMMSALAWAFSLINIWIFILALIGLIFLVQLEQARYLGNSLRIHGQQFPELYSIFIKYAEDLGIKKANLYISQDPFLNAHTIGIGVCSVVLSSSLVEQLDAEELRFVIAHELGHFQAGHTKVSSIFIPLSWGNYISDILFGLWQRQAEYTADQCALILTKDVDIAINVMLKLTVGGNLFEKVDKIGYLAQIKKANGITLKVSELAVSHPLTTNRVKNLIQYWKENFIKI